MTREFFEEVMRIPSCSKHENMMIDFLMKWGKANGCRTKRDGKGNVYLEKGSGIRPTLINHIDTVHRDQIDMVDQMVFKEIVWNGDHVTALNPLTKKQTGLGMDNQGGACIALAVVARLKAVKAIFTVEEEIGMLGIKAANMEFFDDAAFVISNDSPEENRATHYSSGVQLYSDEFFKTYLEPICKKHGVTSFRSEPWTCIKEVRRNWVNKDGKHLECLNFGNAGDHPHTDQEGASFKGVCNAEELLYALCTEIPSDKQHVSAIEEPKWSSSKWSGGKAYGNKLSKDEPDDDEDFGNYIDELFGLGDDMPNDWQNHDDSEVCQFMFTYDDDDQFTQHKSLCDDEGILVEFGDYDERTGTVTVEGELQDIKDAYLLWYQIFNNDPYIKTWEQLEHVDDLSDFNEGLIFLDDLDGLDDDSIEPEDLDDDEPKEEDEDKSSNIKQMDLFDWIDNHK